MGFFIIAALIIIVVVAFAQSNEAELKHKAHQEAFRKNITAKYGAPTKVINDYAIGSNETVYVFEEPEIIVIKGKEYRFDSLLDFSINGGQSYKVTTSTGSALGRGLVGGALLGGVGALAGVGTASKKVNPNDTDYLICITTRDLSQPMIEYRTKSEIRANEFISVLKIILDRNNH